MKSIFTSAFVLLSTWSAVSHESHSSHGQASFSMNTYLEECGGDLYATCEDQKRIWENALDVIPT